MKNYVLLALYFGFFNLKAAQGTCSYLQQLPEGATQTQQRAALLSCRELMEQKTLLLAAEVKYKEIKQQLANPKKPGNEQIKSQFGVVDTGGMMSSKQVFLLGVSGFKKNRRVKLFFKGNHYYLVEGETFPGGQLKSVNINSAIILKNGKLTTIHLTTIEEVQVSLGLAKSSKNQSRILPIGRIQ